MLLLPCHFRERRSAQQRETINSLHGTGDGAPDETARLSSRLQLVSAATASSSSSSHVLVCLSSLYSLFMGVHGGAVAKQIKVEGRKADRGSSLSSLLSRRAGSSHFGLVTHVLLSLCGCTHKSTRFDLPQCVWRVGPSASAFACERRTRLRVLVKWVERGGFALGAN